MKPISVLVIDDDIGMTDLLTILLTPNHMEVITAASGEEGLELARAHHPDVVILDLYHPKMDGWKVMKALRQFSAVPILVLSSLNDPNLVAEMLDSGADDYVLKPVSSANLIARVKNLVRRPHLSTDNPSLCDHSQTP